MEQRERGEQRCLAVAALDEDEQFSAAGEEFVDDQLLERFEVEPEEAAELLNCATRSSGDRFKEREFLVTFNRRPTPRRFLASGVSSSAVA